MHWIKKQKISSFFLIEYNNKLMKELKNGHRIGVPQGPAYARIIAEMFLDRLLDRAFRNLNMVLFMYIGM